MGSALEALHALLDGSVRRTPWVAQYGSDEDFGIGDPRNPYVRACRAECMLAVLLLFVEGNEVTFIDDERLKVLQDAPTPSEILAVKQALT